MNNAFICFPGFKDKAVTLSYDDGVRQERLNQKNTVTYKIFSV